MKIQFQNPTKGPLITVTFDSDANPTVLAYSLVGATRSAIAATEGLATLRTAAQFAEVAPGAAGGVAGGAGAVGIAGPLALIAMLFAAGDSPTHSEQSLTTSDATSHTPSPAELRCMMDPYNTSAECAAVRSALSLIPFADEFLSDLKTARASAGAITPTPGAAQDLSEDVTSTTASWPTTMNRLSLMRSRDLSVLAAALYGNDLALQLAAARGLGQLGTPDAVDLLFHALHVRSAPQPGIDASPPQNPVPLQAIIELLQLNRPNIIERLMGVSGLSKFTGNINLLQINLVPTTLIQILEKGPTVWRSTAALRLGRTQTPAAEQALMAATRQGLSEATIALGHYQSPQAQSLLTEILWDRRTPNLQISAALAMAQHLSPAVIDRLREVKGSGNDGLDFEIDIILGDTHH